MKSGLRSCRYPVSKTRDIYRLGPHPEPIFLKSLNCFSILYGCDMFRVYLCASQEQVKLARTRDRLLLKQLQRKQSGLLRVGRAHMVRHTRAAYFRVLTPV
jgi:hypothetical protein